MNELYTFLTSNGIDIARWNFEQPEHNPPRCSTLKSKAKWVKANLNYRFETITNN